MAEIKENIFEAVKGAGQRDITNFVNMNVEPDDHNKLPEFRNSFRNGFNFNQFSSLKNSFEFIEKIREEKPNTKQLKFVSDSQYKNFETFSEYTSSSNKSFVEAKNITENILENIKSFINIGGLLEKDKIIITEDKRGMFDFGLASLGLYRPIEFYSKDLKNDIENGKITNPFSSQGLANGVVNANEVRKNTFGEDVIFVYKYDNKNYECERRQRGATSVFNEFSNICYLNPNQDGIVLTYDKKTNKVFNGKGRTKLKYASNNKKSYLIFNKKDESVKYVDIFIPVNFLIGNNDVMFLRLISPLLIAGALEEYGVSVRINSMRIGTDSGILTAISIPLKDYNQPVKESLNEIFNILGQKRVAGEYFAFFKTYFQANSVQTRQLSNPAPAFSDVNYDELTYMNEMMGRYKNWVSDNKDQPFVNTKVTNPNFQFAINQLYKQSEGKDEIDYEFIGKHLHKIFYDFYYFLDFLAIEMLPMSEFIKQIYNRYVDDENFNSLFKVPKSTKEKKEVIRKYVISILLEKYLQVTGGEYEDTPLQKKEKDEMFESKLEFLDESLNAIG